MENLRIKISSGQYIELTDSDMSRINEYYETQCTADYLRENNPDWDEEKIQEIALSAREKINDYGVDEDEAIEEAISEWDEIHEEDDEEWYEYEKDDEEDY